MLFLPPIDYDGFMVDISNQLISIGGTRDKIEGTDYGF